MESLFVLNDHFSVTGLVILLIFVVLFVWLLVGYIKRGKYLNVIKEQPKRPGSKYTTPEDIVSEYLKMVEKDVRAEGQFYYVPGINKCKHDLHRVNNESDKFPKILQVVED